MPLRTTAAVSVGQRGHLWSPRRSLSAKPAHQPSAQWICRSHRILRPCLRNCWGLKSAADGHTMQQMYWNQRDSKTPTMAGTSPVAAPAEAGSLLSAGARPASWAAVVACLVAEVWMSNTTRSAESSMRAARTFPACTICTNLE